MNELALLNEANERHAATRHPRWARIAEWASKRLDAAEPRPVKGAGGKKADEEAWQAVDAEKDPRDVPRLFAAIVKAVKSGVAAERITSLGKRKDARIVSGILAVLENPPWRAGTALPFFRACVAQLVASKDARAFEGLSSLSKRYPTIVDSSIGTQIGELCARGVRTMGEVRVEALSKDDELRLAELEQHFEPERRAADSTLSDKKRSATSDDALLSAIYENPDDDGPRLVYADSLSERGDELGEFITLQIRRARGEGTFETLAREQELLADGKRRARLTLPLSAGGACLTHRGFPVGVALTTTGAKSVVGSPAWATVTEVTLPYSLPGKHLRALVESPAMSRVTTVNNVTGEARRHLSERVYPWTDVHFDVQVNESLEPLRERFPHLTTLRLASPNRIPLSADLLSGLPRVEALLLSMWSALPAGDWLSLFPALRSLTLRTNDLASVSNAALRARPLRELRVSYNRDPSLTEGLKLETFEVGHAPGEVLVQIIERLAAVKTVVAPAAELKGRWQPLLEAVEKKGGTRIEVHPQIWLERSEGEWKVKAELNFPMLTVLTSLADESVFRSLTVFPSHPSPLERPGQLPPPDKFAPVEAAWGRRLTVLERNPYVLEESLRAPRLR